MPQDLLGIELNVECNACIFAVHPNDAASGTQFVAAKFHGRAFERKVRAFDERAFRRQVAELHPHTCVAMLQFRRKQDLRAAGAAVLAICAAVHLKFDKRAR